MMMDRLPPVRWPITVDLQRQRHRLRRYATRAGLPPASLTDLILAFNEAAANVLDHGGAGTAVAYTDGSGLWVDVIDTAGTLTRAHLDGKPATTASRGAGLLIIRSLCTQVILDHPNGHSRLRLHFPRPQAPSEPNPPEPRPDSAPRRPTVSAHLLIHCHTLDGVTVIDIAGELDTNNADDFVNAVDKCLHTPGGDVILDLPRLSFIDSTGLRALLHIHATVARHGGTLHLAALHEVPARLMEVAGVLEALPVSATVAEAREAIRAARTREP